MSIHLVTVSTVPPVSMVCIPTCLTHLKFSLLHIFCSQMFLWIPREGSREVTECLADTCYIHCRECGPLTSRKPFPWVVILDLYTFLQIAVKCCDGGKAFSHQEALWATSGMFATHYDVDSGLIEMLVCLVLAIIPWSRFTSVSPKFISNQKLRALSPMTCILIRRGEDTQKEKDHVKMEAETGVMSV